MRVTFLGHSGFLVELDSVYLLFDWWKGELPALLPGKPLLCFASHQHQDHFAPHIFSLDDGQRPVRFLLGKGIRLTPRNREKWGLRQETAEKCTVLSGGETCALAEATVETLRSTDEGVAFLVQCGAHSIYHAGDLNWWHWEGEDKAWNRNMEADFKRYIEPLRGRSVDLAMVPLDPRLESAADWGLRYLLELAEVKRIVPMHQWEDYRPTAAFAAACPENAEKLIVVSRPGQSWAL